MIPRRPLWRRALPAAGLAAIGAFAVCALPGAVDTAASRFVAASAARGDDARAALVRMRGAPYADGLDRIRAALPEDAEYLLVENEADPGTDIIVRFDLAPRRAIFGGKLRDFSKATSREDLGRLPRWAVVPAIAAPGPRLVETRVLAAGGEIP